MGLDKINNPFPAAEPPGNPLEGLPKPSRKRRKAKAVESSITEASHREFALIQQKHRREQVEHREGCEEALDGRADPKLFEFWAIPQAHAVLEHLQMDYDKVKGLELNGCEPLHNGFFQSVPVF